MRLPGSLRARLTLAALLAVLIGGLIAGTLLLAAVERDGRRAVDQELREQTAEVLRGPPGEGRFGRGPRGGQPLLRGSGTFVRVAVGDEVVAQDGDVPDSVPAPPAREGFLTVEIAGTDWRSLTVPLTAAAVAIIDGLEEAGLPPELTEDGLMIDVELDEPTAETWMRSFTDLRLALATRLGVEEGDEAYWQSLPDDDPRAQAHDIYEWVGYLQETIIEALSE